MKPETGAIAGATLMPMVMNAQISAAKADTICVLAYCAMMYSLLHKPDHSGYSDYNAQAMPNHI